MKRKTNGNGTLPLKGKFTPFPVLDRERKKVKALKEMTNTEVINPGHGVKRPPPPPEKDPAKKRSKPATEVNDVLRDMGYCDDDQLMAPSDLDVSGDEC